MYAANGSFLPIDFEAIFRSLPDCYLLIDTSFHIVAASDAFFRVSMTREEDVIGQYVFSVFPDNPSDPQINGVRNVAHALERVIDTKQSNVMPMYQYDIRRPDKTFEERYWSTVCFPVFAADRVTVEYIYLRVEDVTEFVLLKRRELEQHELAQLLQDRAEYAEAQLYLRSQEVYESNRQLEHANQLLEAQYLLTRELSQRKTQFFTDISHELRTPLTLILGPIRQLLNSRHWADMDQRMFEIIERNAQVLLNYVNDLLDVISLETSKVAVKYVATDCVHLLQEVMDQFELLAQSRKILFTLDTPQTLQCHTDPEKFLRICMNLLSNAFKYVPDEGKVQVTLINDEEYVQIRIVDNGPGIEPDARDVIFERFSFNRGDKTNATHSSNGLGLAICKGLIELLHGSILVTDASEGSGALFEITLPRWASTSVPEEPVMDFPLPNLMPQPASIVEVSPSEVSKRESDQTNSMEDCPLVLVVEDNPDMGQFIADVLAPYYRIEIACNGRQGIDKALLLKPDLVLTDILMPEVSGEQLVYQLRCHPELDNTSIVLLSARSDKDYRAELLLAGAQDYLTKPFSAQELLARLANLITMKRTREFLQVELISREKDILTLVRELTLRKNKLEKLAEERRQTAECLRQQARALAEANQYKSDFFARMSHELRTPLNCILILSEQLANNHKVNLSAPQIRHAEMIFKSGSDLLALVNDILDISAMELGKLRVNLNRVATTDLVTYLEDTLLSLASKKGIACEVEVQQGTPPALWTDFQRVSQILRNLVDNAVKFTTNGSVRVCFMPSEDDPLVLEVAVIDTGLGIASDQYELIFQAFEKVIPDIGHYTAGAGLGLSITKQLANLLGGYVIVNSTLGKGSTFTLKLPINLPQLAERSMRPAASKKSYCP